MIMNVVRWPLRNWASKKFKVELALHRLEGLHEAELGLEDAKLAVDVKWNGPRRALSSHFRRKSKTERTSEMAVAEGTVPFEQEFEKVCALTLSKCNKFFQPWLVFLVIRKVTPKPSYAKNSSLVLGTAVVDLATFAPTSGDASETTAISFRHDLGAQIEVSLSVTFNFVELPTVHHCHSEVLHQIVAPTFSCISGTLLWHRNSRGEIVLLKRIKRNGRKRSLTEVQEKKVLSESVTPESEKLSPLSDKSSYGSLDLIEFDSVDERDDNDDVTEENVSSQISLGYSSIAGTNLALGGSFHSDLDELEENNEYSDMLSLHRAASPISSPLMEETSSDSDQNQTQSSMRSLLSWRKRKLTFRSPKAKGAPLLNKAYGENGGDEIDWDRRQSSLPLTQGEDKLEAIVGHDGWDFGETFRVGSWEHKVIVSRDDHMKLSAEVFFASIDQRSESAAGESACTALVVVIADWLHKHKNIMPINAEFNTIIREGSAEWRRLCEEERYKDHFSDGHFDLETIIQAAIRPLSVVSERSFIGFFQPEDLGDSASQFLQGAMSFDSIWNEIQSNGPAIYVVSWNDHFFVLKMEESCCYLIDTLGERLYECCNQAFIVKFDELTYLRHIFAGDPQHNPVPENKPTATVSHNSIDTVKETDHCAPASLPKEQPILNTTEIEIEIEKPNMKDTLTDPIPSEKSKPMGSSEGQAFLYSGKNACREFIRGFLAALPLRELQNDLKKGVQDKNYLHRRLQIEFHFTRSQSDLQLIG
ncbi:hypothetical protein O6H91_07G020000 [Diphasiastrum complanatum]|uniref:Uncharacterized protein n=1 Tax=Diphasiastrum complanatum TaxID=34168 RepID=A0ACC2D2Y2_DIPCM|nr:hypothetical protein O6H91_07G020000 [Diphasiastrum complanatum]